MMTEDEHPQEDQKTSMRKRRYYNETGFKYRIKMEKNV